jgi:transposase
VTVGYSTLCRCLHELDLVQKCPRPRHKKGDPQEQEVFKEQVHTLLNNPAVDLWFLDETAVWADPPPYRVWAKKGTVPILPRLNSHARCNVMGAVRPADGSTFTLIINRGNARMLQIFIRELQPWLNPDKRTVMILDNAKFHKSPGIDWGSIEPLYLPAYSPELNPIEELWLQMKKTFFKAWTPSKNQPLDERVFTALKFYDRHPEKVQSACAMSVYLRE